MNRRNFIKDLQIGGIALYTVPAITWQCSQPKPFEGTNMIPAEVTGAEQVITTPDFRVAFGWSAEQLEAGDTITVKPTEDLPRANLYLRFTPALEMRDIKLLSVYTSKNDELLGVIDIRNSSVLVPYELKIDQQYIDSINQDGLKITLESEKPFGFYAQSPEKAVPPVFTPHFLVSSKEKGDLKDFLDCFMSVKSIQTFGWREGTVLDGLWQLYTKKGEDRALQAIKDHFDLYFDDNQDLHYENSHNVPRDNRIDGIESTIPYATLTRVNPDHKMLKNVISGLEGETRENGMITGSLTLTAEGCYTVAYPLAVIGKAWNDASLMQKAIDQLKHRFVLIEDGSLYLRYYTDRDEYTFRNWARGAAWTLLGFARTIVELKDDIQDEEVQAKFKEGIDIALSMQQENGLWNGFMHMDNAPDTSGSSGISAAIMTGINNGLLPESYRAHAERCWTALQDYLTPDGFLKSVSQDNRGGEALQASNYRVIAQMGMGLMAQLYAEL